MGEHILFAVFKDIRDEQVNTILLNDVMRKSLVTNLIRHHLPIKPESLRITFPLSWKVGCNETK